MVASRAKRSVSVTLKTTAAKTIGARMPAPLLQMPIRLMRRAADSAGPSTVMYGFAAVCRIAKPAPSVNRPPRKTP